MKCTDRLRNDNCVPINGSQAKPGNQKRYTVKNSIPEAEKIRLLARLNRIPVWALPKSFLAIIGIGYFFTFYDISNIGFAMPAINEQFHLSNATSLFLALSVGLIGYIIGSFIIGTLWQIVLDATACSCSHSH